MNQIFRRLPSLLGGTTLVVVSFASFGCHYINGKNVFGEDMRRFPAIVLHVDDNQWRFNWKETTFGGAPISQFTPKQKYYRLNMFDYYSGELLPNQDTKFYEIASKDSIEFKDLLLEKLVRIDCDLSNNSEGGGEDADTYSFVVLFHKE
jgi:hypothetical protein